jgi:hypothetical protein
VTLSWAEVQCPFTRAVPELRITRAGTPGGEPMSISSGGLAA